MKLRPGDQPLPVETGEPDIMPTHPSFFQAENVEEDERPIAVVSFIEAPPDDTDWPTRDVGAR